MDEKYAPLFTPWKVGNVEIKNRIVMLPMEGTNMIAWEAKTSFVKGIENLYRDRKGSKAKKDNRTKDFVNAYSSNGRPEVYFVGDCDKVGSLRTVIKQAYELVQKISY